MTKEEIAEQCADRLLGNVIDIYSYNYNVNLNRQTNFYAIQVSIYLDPCEMSNIINNIGVNKRINIHHLDEEVVSIYGFIQSFDPNEIIEGEMPTAELEIIQVEKIPEIVYCDKDTGEVVHVNGN